jgi:uncharacterized protein (TIGR03083 family)
MGHAVTVHGVDGPRHRRAPVGDRLAEPGHVLPRNAEVRIQFDRFANGQIAKHRGTDPAATLGEFRGLQNSTSAPPGPKTSWLGEVVIHGADVRRPLGIPHAYPPGAVRQVIDFYKGSNMLIGSKNRIAGLALAASDDDWQHGRGERVEGPLLSLLLAMTGRGAACDDLAGPGVQILRGRCVTT